MNQMPLLLQIEELLTANGYGDPEEFLCEWDVAPERWILEMDTYLHPPKVESASTFAMKRPRWLSFSRSNSLCAFFFCCRRGATVRKQYSVWRLSTNFMLSLRGVLFVFWTEPSGPAVYILRPGRALAEGSSCTHCTGFWEQWLRCTTGF